MAHLTVRGAREHNLKDIDLTLPKRQLIVVTGVSGSGKSSLVFDTIAAESQRQLNETYTTFVRNRLPRYGQPDVDSIDNLSAAIVVDQRRLGGNSRSTVGTVTDIHPLMRLLWSREGRPFAGYSNAFSFNEPAGMCQRCHGIGRVRTIDLDQLVDRRLSLNDGAIRFPTFDTGSWMWRTFANSGLFDNDKPLAAYDGAEWDAFLHGVEDPPKNYEGLLHRFERIWLPKDPESLKGRTRQAFERVVTQSICPDCGGARLNAAALESKVDGLSIADCAAMEAADLAEVVRAWTGPVATALLAQLERLVGIGLGYVTLDRPTTTLSGGESQRVKMVRHLGSGLTDMTYIFDEPTIGLHPRDVGQLVGLLKDLRDKGNTVLVVEHDPDVIEAADHVVDLGPGAGPSGGEVVYEGCVRGLVNADTPTGRHLRRRPSLRAEVRKPTGAIAIRGADKHNLDNVDVDVPTGVLTVVTGVAGSGKSTLVRGYLPDAVVIDQGAVRGSRRSSIATYTGVLDRVRTLFAEENGVSSGLFSPNAEGGCPGCHGLGLVHTDLAFLDPMVSVCEQCRGRRFTEAALRYRCRGLDIGQVLELTARDACEVFDEPPTRAVLERLIEVGLDYLSLGQPLNTLSGGERQRLKLADELGHSGRTYVFDEPTTGLHMSDVDGLVALLDRLVDGGRTVVVIEHNLDVIARADWIIDLGPGPGRRGGQVVFQGTPVDLVRAGHSLTGEHLRKSGDNRRRRG
ncbi:ATP-binding cassette domain-containing protein [Fodinicola acaciae]|uniref:ATP-binding cassette domain-containing protein n=1 Tax=Fodinicola acaciae TaxID=2681555 RepID=UPI0013D5942F|nr:excinuclease ABC subunit UvrA [Fodinicola acaciae]